jgi:hypothetical protein
MQLKFYAREDALVRRASIAPRIGEAARYYGRTFDPGMRAYVADKEPFVVDSDNVHGEKCRKQCQKGALWPADEATAAAVGVEFVETMWDDGAVVAKPKIKPKPAIFAKEAS